MTYCLRELNIVTPPEEDLLCILCNEIVNPDVKQFKCGHLSCCSCLSNLVHSSESTTCPGDREECKVTFVLNNEHVSSYFGIESELGNLRVHCVNLKNGCNEQLLYRNLAAHLEHCVHRGSRIAAESVLCCQEESTLPQEITGLTTKVKNQLEGIDSLDNRLSALENANTTYDGMYIWKIKSSMLNKLDEIYTSPPFYSGRHGYKMCLLLCTDFQYTMVNLGLMRGEHDAILKWPFEAKINLQLLKIAHQERGEHKTLVFHTDPFSENVKKPILGTAKISEATLCLQASDVIIGSLFNRENEIYIKARIELKDSASRDNVPGHPYCEQAFE